MEPSGLGTRDFGGLIDSATEPSPPGISPWSLSPGARGPAWDDDDGETRAGESSLVTPPPRLPLPPPWPRFFFAFLERVFERLRLGFVAPATESSPAVPSSSPAAGLSHGTVGEVRARVDDAGAAEAASLPSAAVDKAGSGVPGRGPSRGAEASFKFSASASRSADAAAAAASFAARASRSAAAARAIVAAATRARSASSAMAARCISDPNPTISEIAVATNTINTTYLVTGRGRGCRKVLHPLRAMA